jgi:hypothetical protein
MVPSSGDIPLDGAIADQQDEQSVIDGIRQYFELRRLSFIGYCRDAVVPRDIGNSCVGSIAIVSAGVSRAFISAPSIDGGYYDVLIRLDDGTWFVAVPDIPVCIGYGFPDTEIITLTIEVNGVTVPITQVGHCNN